MPSSIGFIPVDVIPVVRGIGSTIAGQFTAPLAAAGLRGGRAAGEGMVRGIQDSEAAVRKASESVAKARDKEMDAAGKVRIAEAALQDLRDKGIQNGARYTRAVEALETAQRRSVATTRDARKAAEQLAAAEREAATATDDLEESTEDSGGGLSVLGDKAKEALGSLKSLAAGAVGIGATITAGIAANMDADVINDRLAASLDASPKLAGEYGKITGDLYRQNFGESMEDVATAVEAVQSSFYTLGFEGEASIEQVTSRAMNFASVFGTDVQDSVQTVSQLMNQGLIKNSTEGFDLLTASFQRIPMAMREELPEILQEYGVNFQALGFTGEQAFNALVLGAQKGKFSLDKTGDALKEFTILGSDMSEASQEAYRSIGLDAEVMSDKIATGGAGAQEALQATAKGLLAIEDPSDRANTAIALFGTPLEDLSIDQIPAFLESLTGSENAMAGFAGAADKMGTTLSDNGTAKLEAFKRTLMGGVQDGLAGLAMWVSDNVPLLKDLGVAAGAAALGLGALALQQKIVAAGGFLNFLKAAAIATKAWATQTSVLNIVMGLNPVGAIVLAVIALVAAIVIAYRNSEKFREIIQKLWSGIKVGAQMMWDFVKPIFGTLVDLFKSLGDVAMWLWHNAIVPAFNGVTGAISAAWPVAKGIFDAIVVALKFVGSAAMWLWNNAIVPAFKGIQFAISLWWAGVQIYWEFLKLAWKAIETAALWLWHGVIEPVFSGIKGAIGLWWTGVQIYWDLLVAAWRFVETAAMWLWHGVIEPVFSGISSAIEFAWNTIIKPVFDAITTALGWIGDKANWLWQNVMVPAWDGIKNAISGVWEFIRPVLDKIGVGIQAVGDISAKVGDAMRTAFDGVVGVIKAPINMVGKLLAKMPESILGVDIPGAKTIKNWGETLQNLRSGGTIAGRTASGQFYGPGTGTSDSLFGVDANGRAIVRVSAGEGVVTADAMDNGGDRVVAALNGGADPDRILGGLQALAGGGVIGEPYGLPPGSSGGPELFPPWVTDLGNQFGVEPSTYAGHQEDNRAETGYAPNPEGLNRGIDWTGDVASLHGFAQHLVGIGPSTPALEQVIWQNPETGEQLGWAGGKQDDGSYFAGNYAGHTDHVHSRQSASLTGGSGAPAPSARTVYNTQTPTYTPPDYGPDGPDASASTTGGAAESKQVTRMKSFKELGSDLGGILAEGIGETFGLPSWIMDPQGYLDSNTDTGESVRVTESVTGDQATGPSASPSGQVGTADIPGTPSATPNGLTGHDLYAFQIAKAALDKGMGRAAAVIGEATGLVEAGDPLKMWANEKLPESLNLPHDAVGNNGTSTGIFQQQDFPEWGTLQQRMDPYGSAVMFYDHFPSGWEGMDPGAVAQAVQRSAFPDKYGQAMGRANELVDQTKLFDTGGIWEPGTLGFNDLDEPELVLKKHQWGVMNRNAAVVEDMANAGSRGGSDNRIADTINVQGYTAEEIAEEWARKQWSRTAGYGTSRNR